DCGEIARDKRRLGEESTGCSQNSGDAAASRLVGRALMPCAEMALRRAAKENASSITVCGITGPYRRRGSIHLAELRASHKCVRCTGCDTFPAHRHVSRTDNLPAVADHIRELGLPGSHGRSTPPRPLQP